LSNFIANPSESPGAGTRADHRELEGLQRATFAAGCFWGVEASFRGIEGVVYTSVGYTGGTTADPSYDRVCSGATGHAESVDVWFDPAIVSYDDLLRTFWSIHNPTTPTARAGISAASTGRRSSSTTPSRSDWRSHHATRIRRRSASRS
jgi:methionine-S-sulfoxide reductase